MRSPRKAEGKRREEDPRRALKYLDLLHRDEEQDAGKKKSSSSSSWGGLGKWSLWVRRMWYQDSQERGPSRNLPIGPKTCEK